MVSLLRAALHPSPGPSSPPRWGCRAGPHLPPTLMKGHQKAFCVQLSPLPHWPPSPAFSAPIRNQTAWEKLGWEPAADSDLGTLPSLPSACPPRPAPHRPLQGNQGLGVGGRGKALKGIRTRTCVRTRGWARACVLSVPQDSCTRRGWGESPDWRAELWAQSSARLRKLHE